VHQRANDFAGADERFSGNVRSHYQHTGFQIPPRSRTNHSPSPAARETGGRSNRRNRLHIT
jgi:hypothetical protein